jgi:hypothetical protein
MLFAILGFDQDYIVMLYQSISKRHLNPSLAVLNFYFKSGLSVLTVGINCAGIGPR